MHHHPVRHFEDTQVRVRGRDLVHRVVIKVCPADLQCTLMSMEENRKRMYIFTK